MLLKKSFQLIIVFTFISLCSCSFTTYTPRTKRQQQLAQPSVVLIQRIIDYREKYNSWPLSKEEFIHKDSKYREAFIGFPYQTVRFEASDNDNMIFYFEEHIQDVKNYNNTQKVNLNAYHGKVTFHKSDGKFAWKIKMY